jgi:hypothetical protein
VVLSGSRIAQAERLWRSMPLDWYTKLGTHLLQDLLERRLAETQEATMRIDEPNPPFKGG